MPKVTTSTSFSEDDQLTHTSLNALFTNSSFHSSAVDDTTLELSSGAMRLKAAGSGNGIATSHINDDAITVAQIADDAVETAQIKDAAVVASKLGLDAVDGTKIADDAIDQTHLAANLISGHAEELTALPSASQDLVLVSVNGVLKKFDFMKWLPLPRAYSKIVGSSTPSLAGEYACSLASYANGSGASTYTITLANAMADTNYVVNVQVGPHLQHVYWHDEDTTPSVQVDSPNQFRIHWHSNYKLYDLYFVVHGELSGAGYAP